MKKKSKSSKIKTYDFNRIIILLMSYLVLLNISLLFINYIYFIIATVVNIFFITMIAFVITKHKKIVQSLVVSEYKEGTNTHKHLEELQIPVVIIINKSILWYNNAFKEMILAGNEAHLDSIYKLLPGYDKEKCHNTKGQCLTVDNSHYTVYCVDDDKRENVSVLYLVNDTELKVTSNEYTLSRPAVMYILIDTYDELKKDLKESERAKIMGEINLVLETYIARTTGFLIRVAANKYIALLETRHVEEFSKERFNVIDKVRQIGGENCLTTLSIGVGNGENTFLDGEAMAKSALEMCLGRGGDQVAVKTSEGYTFFGGVTRAVENRSKVKARIVAKAISEAIEVSDSVVIMGHKQADMDSMGAAIGVLNICKHLNKPACIIINEKTSLAKNIIVSLRLNHLDESLYEAETVLQSITDKTLLIIVDTHLPWMVESSEIYEKSSNVVVIDHHRKMVGHIDNAVIFYHEPYASSTCEMVSEILQYTLGKDSKLNTIEAEALLAGIMLDTRDFTIHTGVRTFEAAGYLRRMGARTVETKKLFASSLDSYRFKAHLVSSAEIYNRCAISVIENLPEEMRVAIPQAANDLLTIQGIAASFVALISGEKILISARSLGELNVQVLMENLGGGGHLTMAGAQVKDKNIDEVIALIKQEIDEYWDAEAKVLQTN